mgnify:CR=1 FL=1|jgi:hypothetical protein
MPNEYELYHYGTKGMKWGVRRYQNKDGSLNAKGIKRYAQKGYAQDALNSNKTKAGRIYDRLTDAHKYSGQIKYGTSSDKQNKARAEKYVAEKAAEKQNAAKKREAHKKNLDDHTTIKIMKELNKAAIGSAGLALGTAAVGSAATFALAKAGKTAAAESVYKLSRKAFGDLAGSAIVNAGGAFVTGNMISKSSYDDYRKKERQINEAYK